MNTYSNKQNAAAVLAHEIGQRLLDRLDVIRLQPTHILDLSTNAAPVTQDLAQRYSSAEILTIDILHAPNPLPLPTQSIDLIFSNLILHRCAHVDTVFAELKRVLKPEGLLLFSTLGPDTLQEFRHSWAGIDHKIPIPSFADMHNIGDELVRAKFADPVMDMEKITFTYRDLAGLAHDFNEFENYHLSLPPEPNLQKFTAAYEDYRDDKGLLPVTFEVIYGHAWNPAPSTNISTNPAEVFVPINAINKLRTKK